MIQRIVFNVLFLCTSLLIGACSSNPFDTVDGLVEETKARSAMPSGTAIIAMRGDEIVYESYFGFADIQSARSVDKDTVFYIASTTKAVMGLAILLAEARGEISRTTTLQELFPELQFSDIEAEKITVHHLLTHTSGIDNEPLTWAMSYTGLHTEQSRLPMIASSYPSADASLGEFEYSNIGYNIMAVWMDEHYGIDWRNTFNETILAPLGMTKTSGFISEGIKNDWALTKPYSYKVGDGEEPLYLYKTDDTMYSVGLLATARDTARFVMASMNDGELDGEQVFPPEVLQTQREQQIKTDGGYFDGYAYGWMTGERLGQGVRLHTGGFSGATASISYMPEERIGVVILHNENGLKANWLNSIAEEAAYAALLGQSDEEIDKLVRDDIEQLAERASQAHATLAADAIEREAAVFELSLPADEYAGRYIHPHAGEIKVTVNADGRFDLRWGLLQGEGHPGEAKNVIEVNFRPGSFDPLAFEVDSELVTGLMFNGVQFRRSN